MSIDIKNIERYWQKVWKDEKSFTPSLNNNKPKFFNFDSAPFPNGNLHLGHARNYVLGDIIARYKRLNNYNVLYTTNFDSFGLPNQLEAEKKSIEPEQYTQECIALIKNDLKRLGISYDWSRVNSTSDPKYYKWTQWLFLELYSAGLVYRKESNINWCETCDSVLANMEVVDGKCNRCNGMVKNKSMPQWFIALSKYSSELYNSIDDLNGWSDRAKNLTKGFIGKTTGSLVSFSIQGKNEFLDVFLSEKDELSNVTFVSAAVDAPELHNLTDKQFNSALAQQLVSSPVSKRRRNKQTIENREGLDSGLKLINPASGLSIPLFYVNYLSNEVGPSIKAGVPASNQQDKVFSEKYKISEIIKYPCDLNTNPISKKNKSYYHVHDWVVSRQKKWGTPIPMLECPTCGFVPVKKENLPVINRPLAEYKETESEKCPVCNENVRAVADTLDCYIDDIWCFYSSELNTKDDFSLDKAYDLNWFPANHYHAGYDIYMYLHLYRFITRFLNKHSYVKSEEPISIYFGHDMVLQDGKKMSKHHNNSQSIRLLLNEHGADTLRIAMILIANPEKPVRWTEDSLKRAKKQITKMFDIASLLLNMKIIDNESDENNLGAPIKKRLNMANIKLKKEVTKYIESYRPGSAVQSLEKHSKELYKIISSLPVNYISNEDYAYIKNQLLSLCILYSPFAPHMSEEIWHKLGGHNRIYQARWPT